MAKIDRKYSGKEALSSKSHLPWKNNSVHMTSSKKILITGTNLCSKSLLMVRPLVGSDLTVQLSKAFKESYDKLVIAGTRQYLGPVVRKVISANPGLNL